MIKVQKRQIKIVAVAVAAVFLLSVVGIAVSQTGTSQAAASSNVGKVNYEDVIRSHPDFAKYIETMKAEQEQAQKDFDAKAPTLGNDKERQDYFMQLQQRLNLKQSELIKPIDDKVMAAIKEVSEARGLTVVLPMNMVVYGGQDITEDVKKKFGGK